MLLYLVFVLLVDNFLCNVRVLLFFFFKQKPAYEMRFSDWSSDVCSSDLQHPQWFSWRPDGSIRYAENPPKRYEDIVNVDFYADDARSSLWLALRDVVEFWIGEGVSIFRVDNPHTKPLPFWQWLIADIRSRHPDAIFLAEAFTRPAMMYRLGKIGFTQSYTYFTWRHSRQDRKSTRLNSSH